MLRNLRAAASWSLLLVPAAAAAADLPADVRLADSVGLAVEWTLPAGAGSGCVLVLDPSDRPWLGCRGRYLLAPEYALVRDLGAAYSTLAWTKDGLTGASGDAFGVYEGGGFRALASFPGRSVRAVPGAGGAVYVLVSGPEGDEVYVTAAGARRTVLKTRQKVTAAGGDGQRHFAAVGRRVYEVGEELTALSEELPWDVDALEYDPGSGLFYRAGGAIGRLGPHGEEEFLYAPGAQMRLAGGALYVMPASGGVLRLAGLDAFAARDAALAGR